MIKSVGIVGAGTMGNGIAQVAARAGFDVVLYDISTEVLKDAMARIKEDFRRGVEKGKITATEATADHFKNTDVFELEIAADPQISPDGSQIAYARRSNDIMTDRTRSNIWIVGVVASKATDFSKYSMA